MTTATKTVNPLHFEDLEPHRFEDLVRQLIYDWKGWASLEATGRAGSDDGFDIRAVEIIDIGERGEGEQQEESLSDAGERRTWLVQCKREKEIGPKKLEEHLAAISTNEKLYGFVYVAPAEFSLKARDVFRKKCLALGVQECHILGRSELEDLLFQPKNDHLLFAYFGISLVLRKRSLKTRLRSTLSIKRQSIRCLGDIGQKMFHKPVLLRDSADTHYPYIGKLKGFKTRPPWKVFYFQGHAHNGLQFVTKRFYAYLADDQIHWDYIDKFDHSDAPRHDNPWAFKADDQTPDAHWFWYKIPESNRGWLEIVRVVPYDEILAIDEHGDEFCKFPHVYVPFTRQDGPFAPYIWPSLEAGGSHGSRLYPKKKDRMKYFPETFPKADFGEKSSSQSEGASQTIDPEKASDPASVI